MTNTQFSFGLETYFHEHMDVKMTRPQGAWVAESVRRPALDFCSGHDRRVRRWSPASGSVLDKEPT